MSPAAEPLSTSLSTNDLRALLARRLGLAAAQEESSPLSFGQQRLWFLDQLEPNSPLYNMPSALRLRGRLSVTALEMSLNAIADRHEALRARFVTVEGEPAQVIDEAANIKLDLRDLSDLEAAEQETEMRRLIHDEVNRPFNLSQDRLLRASLLRLGERDHVLILNVHHIVYDEWSAQVLFRELAAYYAGFVAGRPAALPELPVQYSDFAAWQRDWLQGEVYEKQLRFWRNQLEGCPEGIELPTDRPRGARLDCHGAGRWRLLGQDLSRELRELAHREGATPFMLLLAAFKVLLHRYTRQEDIIVGSPVAGRNRIETEGLIGFFVNTLPLRTKLSGEMSFRQLLAQVRETTLNAYSNQDMPFEKLVQALHPERALNQMPFVQVMFLIQQAGGGAPTLPDLEIEFLDGGTETAKCDLTLGVHEGGQGFVATANYNTDLFGDATIARFLEHYRALLAGIVARPEARLTDLPLLTEEERSQLLVEWNNTRTDYPRNRCVHELFEDQARQMPDAIAISTNGRQMTYRELNARANQLARCLRQDGVKRGKRVAVCHERSPELIVALLGILKAGGAYTALDAAWPQERLACLLEELEPPVVLTQRTTMAAVSAALGSIRGATQSRESLNGPGQLSPQLLCLENDRARIARESDQDLVCETEADDLAYVSFTSGSTGRPKGVCVPHRGVVRLVKNTNYARFDSGEVFLQMAPVSFDASTFEIWGCLLNGARLAVFPPQTPSLAELGEFIARQAVTTAWFTSGLFNQLVEESPEALRPLRQVLTGGDVLSPPHVKKALSILHPEPAVSRDRRLVNGYGPTENTTFSTCYSIPADFDGERPVPIGRPIANSQCYILDSALQPVPVGVPGELYAGGDGLALGYLNQPELTAEKFISHPFEAGARLYRTGDLARYLADGTIEFLGRIDEQVKIRGFRVEPGEIETIITQHPGVRQSVVVPRRDASGTKQLVAYFVPQSGLGAPASLPASSGGQQHAGRDAGAPSAEDLQAFLERRLPDYLVPRIYVAMDELPLSRNGKVDRRALPAPTSQIAAAKGAVEPRDDLERQLRQLWEDTLQTKPVGIRDGFFSLGGHSLLAVRLLARVEKTLGKRLTVAALFQNPTIEKMAVLLRGGLGPRQGSSIVDIQPNGTRPPLLLVHGAGGGMFWGYGNLARHLGPDQPVFAFQSRGIDGLPEYDRIETMAEHYVADLRAFQPHGPYYLGGYCFGGLVAYEMARRLRSQGETIGLLALINSTPPNSSYGCFRWTPISTLKFARNFCLRTFYSVKSHPEKLMGFFQWKTRSMLKRLRNLLPQANPEPATSELNFDEWIDLSDYPEDQRRIWEAHIRALAHYHPQRYPGRVTLFRSPVHLLYCSFDPRYGWGELAEGGLTVRVIPGAHETIMEEPRVRDLAMAMRACLSGG